MTTRKPTPEETHEESVADEDLTDEDTWEFPSSSPDKKILTGRALLESGLVGLWKDRTDIGDSPSFGRPSAITAAHLTLMHAVGSVITLISPTC